MISTDQVLGLTLPECEQFLRKEGYAWRIVNQDDQPICNLTMEFNEKRFNLTVKLGIVISAVIG